jgi:lipopolysaccharide export system protein LptA
MINRRTFADDNKGVGEPIDEHDADGKPLRVRTKHYLTNKNEARARTLQYSLDTAMVIVVSRADISL